MAKENVTGQMNLFDLPPVNSKQQKKEETEDVFAPEVVAADMIEEKLSRTEEQNLHFVMEQHFTNEENGEAYRIGYVDYNRIYEKIGVHPCTVLKFTDAKSAVDYYIQQIQCRRNEGE